LLPRSIRPISLSLLAEIVPIITAVELHRLNHVKLPLSAIAITTGISFGRGTSATGPDQFFPRTGLAHLRCREH